jgi:hypothetical protein
MRATSEEGVREFLKIAKCMEVIGDNQFVVYGYNCGIYLISISKDNVTSVKQIKEGKTGV